ncbi:GGDEF domain-containing protein [Streptomyces sp. NP160]|uniref:GGDEF domain-containing protein n=1 Tax=Streptomyces sp. NP160 TaxID=2586637 RepID=UPI00111830EA|nr:GGDEF domain-containing protein [Streptomyces sp. NP160]TNM69359.1 GGDEF domain-containing protein [Streptomyces sp. NP160]
MTTTDAPVRRTSAAEAARALGTIGLLSSAFVLVSTFTPGEGLARDHVGVRWVTLATAVLALGMFAPVWGRLPRRTTLVMAPLALVVIAVHNTVGGDDPYRYGVFYLLLFVWIGAHHPRWTSLGVAPLALVSYTVPLVLLGHPGSAWTAVYAVPVFVVVGEVIAARSRALGRANAELRRLAHTDPLTGLLDRRAFTTSAERLRAGGEAGVLVAFLDLDGFKPVNDRLGHAAGDALLQRIAAYLVSDVRSGDLVGRIGGDEFALLLRGTSATDEDAVVQRLRTAVAEASPPDVPVGASVGLARLDDHPDVEAALRAADTAMYSAKRANRREDELAAGRSPA